MRTLREWLHRLEGTLTRRRRDDDLEEELRLHLELETDAARRAQHHHDGGRRVAHLRAGGVPQAMEALRDQRGVPSLTDMARDMRVAVRGLYGRPGFTAVALFRVVSPSWLSTALSSTTPPSELASGRSKRAITGFGNPSPSNVTWGIQSVAIAPPCSAALKRLDTASIAPARGFGGRSSSSFANVPG